MGNTRIAIIAVCLAILIDWVAGTIVALFYKSWGTPEQKEELGWTSRKMWEGLIHKAAELLLLFIAYAIDFIAPYFNFNLPLSMFGAVATFLVIMEIGSILEKIEKINPGISSAVGSIEDALGIDGEATPEEKHDGTE